MANKGIYTDSNNPVNAISDESIINNIPGDAVVNKTISELEYVGSSYNCMSNTQLSLYFNSTKKLTKEYIQDNYAVNVIGINKNNVKYGLSNGMLKVTLSIPVAELDDTFSVSVKTKNGSINVEYCPLIYIKKVLSGSANQNVKNLCKALYLYNQEANKYFDKYMVE